VASDREHRLEDEMERTISGMTASELRQLRGEIAEEKLSDALGDPDEGLSLRPEMRERLERDMKRVAGGERGKLLGDVVDQLGLT
jgi:hypothetical protein